MHVASRRCSSSGRQAGFLAGHLPGEDAFFQRDDVAVDEFRDEVLEHAVLFGQFEHQRVSSVQGGPAGAPGGGSFGAMLVDRGRHINLWRMALAAVQTGATRLMVAAGRF